MSAILGLLWKVLATPRVAAGLACAGLLAFAGVEAALAHHMKIQLTAARAALVDPATKQTWRAEDLANLQNLATARQNAATLTAALAAQQAMVQTIEAKSAADTAAAQKNARLARAGAVAAGAKAASVLASKPTGNLCAATDALILGSLK